MTPPQRIGVVANIDKANAVETAARAIALLRPRVETIMVQEAVADKLGLPELGVTDAEFIACDLVLVLGGDGTMLATSRFCGPAGTAMLGINLGQFGFLNEIPPENLDSAIDRVLSGDFEVEERLMLCCDLRRGGNLHGTDTALNDIVVAHGPLARVLHLKMTINGQYLTTYASDGVIVATPTGSTAYSLSAGGPLVHPLLDVMLLTPICPHTLTTRTLLIPVSDELVIQVERTDGDYVQVTVDGQRGFPLEPGDTVVIRRAPFRAKLVSHVGGMPFYEKLQAKLRWGERELKST